MSKQVSYCQSCADLQALLSAAQANLLGSLGPDGKRRLEAKRAEAETRCDSLRTALELFVSAVSTNGQFHALSHELEVGRKALDAVQGEGASP